MPDREDEDGPGQQAGRFREGTWRPAPRGPRGDQAPGGHGTAAPEPARAEPAPPEPRSPEKPQPGSGPAEPSAPAPGWSGLVHGAGQDDPATVPATWPQPRTPPGEEHASPGVPARAEAADDFLRDDFADLTPAPEPSTPAPRSPAAPGSSPSPAEDATAGEGDEPVFRLADDELPWGVPARAAADTDAPLPPPEQLAATTPVGRILLAVAGGLVGLLVLALAVLLVVARVRGG